MEPNKANISTADFLFELGTMRKLMRMHRQVFLTDDTSDNITSHSYRVAMIGWFIAKMEGLDPYKTVMMCLLHDVSEVRCNDQNWIHKRYVTVHEEEINKEQLGGLPFPDLFDFMTEYMRRESRYAIVSKDADVLDQLLLLREYEWQGNKEAKIWLQGKRKKRKYARLSQLKTKSAKDLGKIIYDRSPSDWWKNLWTSQRRK